MMDRYKKITMIGKGTFGSAWLVVSKLSGYRYAIKELSVRTMSASDRHLALNEVKILSTLKHRNIVRYKNAFEEESNFYIVMEYAEGGDLYSKIKQSKSFFPQEQILDWLTQLLLALKHIHGQNILHRDLKTQNIFLTKSDVIKLGDFGIARILDNTTDHAQTTVGTPYYLSPEICQRQPYNQKSDMWALGCVMYEITTLKHPFTADCFSSLVVKILHGKYAPISREYGPLLEDLIGVLLRSNPEDRPSAKQLIYVPAMKQYVEKYAVIQRERINSSAAPNQSKLQHEACKPEQYSELKTESSTTKKPEQVKSVSTELEKETNKCASKYSLTPQQESSIQKRSNLKMPSEKVIQKREKAHSVSAEVSGRVRASYLPRGVTHQARRAESVSSAGKSNIQPVKKPVDRAGVLKTEVIPAESSVADNIRVSILKEHEKRRRCPADSGLQPLDVETDSKQSKTRARYKTRTERVYSDITGSSNSVTVVKRDSIQDKSKNRDLFGDRELKIQRKIMKPREKSIESSICRKKPSKDEVPLPKEILLREQRKSCTARTYERNEQIIRKTSPVERNKAERLLVVEEDDIHSSNTTSSDSDEDGLMADAPATSTQPRSNIISQMKTHNAKGGISIKSRDRTASTPCAREARARRRVARESLNYHMNHCRRLRAKSSKSASCETLNKENVYPGTRQQSGFKALPKRNAVVVVSQGKGSLRQNVMVEPSPEFKRCQTYKVAQFRRLPLMSVPDVTRNADTEVASNKKIYQSPCSGRHKSESTVSNPKLTITKFSGLKGAHIDRARRRGRKMSAAVEVGSSRREFSANPDGACAASNKSQLKNSSETNVNDSGPTEEKDTKGNPAENDASACAKDTTKIKFKFRGRTLHLNTSDAKSAFAHMEALRVFLEENLGTKRFIEAYQYLNDSVFLSDKEKKLDRNIQHIIGTKNIEYLPLLYQLIASETNHFGTRV